MWKANELFSYTGGGGGVTSKRSLLLLQWTLTVSIFNDTKKAFFSDI